MPQAAIVESPMRWLTALLVALFLPLGFVAAAEEQEDDIAQVEKGLFAKAKGPRYTIQDRMKYHKVPGVSVAVIRDKAVAWAKGYGLAEANKNVPIGVDTLFQAASMSKPIAALLALLLANSGQFDIDEDVNKYLKRYSVPVNSFTKKKKVTVRELVSHTAGVNVHGFAGYEDGQPFPTLMQVLNGEAPANSAAITVDLTPGTKHRYSGGGYCILQALIEDVTGKDFADAAKTMVLDPLGMKQSHYHLPKKATAKNYAAGHTNAGKVIAGKRHLYPESAAAGLYTTPSEYAQFGIFYLNKGKVGDKQVLTAKWVDEILKKQAKDQGVGLGVFLVPGGFSHNGSNAGFRCSSMFFTARGEGVIVMTNGDNGDALGQEIVNSVRVTYKF
jgi:CubicO group peptidase (beta-lactamase class C family)